MYDEERKEKTYHSCRRKQSAQEIQEAKEL